MALPLKEIEKNEKLLALFWVHSDRLAEHSLWNEPQLKSWVTKETRVTFSSNNSVTFNSILPDRERFESFVARLRPFILIGESIYILKVLNGVKALLFANSSTISEEESSLIEQQKSVIRELLEKTDSPLVFSASQYSVSDPEHVVVSASDKEMAHAFLYGSLIHVDLDQKYEQSLKFDEHDRFEAAVPFYFQIARIVLAVRNLVIELRNSQRFSSSTISRMDQLLEKERSEKSPEVEAELWVYTGDLQPPIDLESIDVLTDMKLAGWEQLGPDSEFVLNLMAPDDLELELWDSDNNRLGAWPCWEAEKDPSLSMSYSTYFVSDFAKVVITQESQAIFHRLVDSNQKALRWFDFSVKKDLATSMRIGSRKYALNQLEEADTASQNIVLEEFFSDIVALEKRLEKELPLLHGAYRDVDRMLARTLRLLFEGKIVPDWDSFRVASSDFLQGKEIGEKVYKTTLVTRPTEVEIANLTVPVPATTVASTVWETRRPTVESEGDLLLISGADGENPMRWLGIEPREVREVALPRITLNPKP